MYPSLYGAVVTLQTSVDDTRDELYTAARRLERSRSPGEDATKSEMEIKEMRCNLYTYEEISPGLFPHSGGATTEQT